jgi:hypothetical protein
LYFPELGVLIHSDLEHFDSLSIGQQVGRTKKEREAGLLHMNVNLCNAMALELKGSFPQGSAGAIEMHHSNCIVTYCSRKDLNLDIRRSVEVIVIDTLKAAAISGTKKPKGSDWISGAEMTKAVEYLTVQQVKEAKHRGIDIVAIFAMPFNCKGTLHALTIRWLCASLPTRSDQESSEIYLFLTSLLSKARGGYEVSRVGGSNGNAHISKEFFHMLHLPGITPRKSCGVMWYPMETKWLFFYISPYKKKHHLACRAYSQPMPGGQLQFSKKKFHASPKYLQSAVARFVTIKAESAPLVSSLNSSLFQPSLGILACCDANIVQETTNYIARCCASRASHKINTEENDEYFFHLLTSCSFTIVAFATRLHVDTPKRHPFLPYKGFWENKWVINVPCKSTNNSKEPALGQGGAG